MRIHAIPPFAPPYLREALTALFGLGAGASGEALAYWLPDAWK
jgi:hypothetical protein